MVVGRGMVAQAFIDEYQDNGEIIIFASGVSNSQEIESSAFIREEKMLAHYFHTPKIFVYFSSCSIYDPDQMNSLYVKHKIEIEKRIKENIENYLIVRLPIVVGNTNNEKNLLPFLVKSISEFKTFQLYTKATRYLMDIDDVFSFVNRLIRLKKFNRVINMNFSNQIAILTLVHTIEKKLHQKAQYNLVDKGSSYSVPNQSFVSFLEEEQYRLKDNYIDTLLEKYFVKDLS
jgi:nucleoside-diphosphate-sugar epimerase